MDCTVQGILQARILEWLAYSFLQVIFPTQDSNLGFSIVGGFFTPELQGKPIYTYMGIYIHLSISGLELCFFVLFWVFFFPQFFSLLIKRR